MNIKNKFIKFKYNSTIKVFNLKNKRLFSIFYNFNLKNTKDILAKQKNNLDVLKNNETSKHNIDANSSNFFVNPYYLAGFTDAEGCFSVLCTRNKNCKTGWRIQVSFQIHLGKEDKNLLEKIKATLGVGKIYDSGNKSCVFVVYSPEELISTIIPFFDKYPLLTQKRADFESFKQVLNIIDKKKHNTTEGLENILSIKASMRNGLTKILAESFPNIVAASKPIIKKPEVLNPNWICGFIDGEGCFIVHIQNLAKSKLGKTVKLQFKITQNERDMEILNLILLYFNCGRLQTDRDCKILTITKFADIINILIPFFKDYPLQGIKFLNLADFIKVAELIENKAHLTSEGLNDILRIKSGMNRGRKYDNTFIE
uniref:LAGLIDADG endonuclease n=1 Tax=Orbilia oligospora TaxID=2813651 RepID=A0A6G6A3H2_ORBOL|nr:LAGLIDADG endonuclease [Orbilia oligospora]